MTTLPPEPRTRWMQQWRQLSERRLHLPAWSWNALMVGTLLAVVLLLSPYWTLWRLSRAAGSATPEALAPFVDLNAVRLEIRRRLNKDVDSRIGDVSEPFIEWIQQGLQHRPDEPIDTLVTLEWIAGLLHDHDSPDKPLLERIHFAFFDPPNGFLVRLNGNTSASTVLLLRPTPLRWRIVAAYY